VSFDLFDFKETLNITGHDPQCIESVRWGFGHSPEGGGSWEGGFVFRTDPRKDLSVMTWVFVFGWCDYTGWGCQDGAWSVEYNHPPSRQELEQAWKKEWYGDLPPHEHWDFMPADLNRWVKGEVDEWGNKIEPPKAKYLGEPVA
jgi:hypothetical protein